MSKVKAFKNLQEIRQFLNDKTKKALELTLEELKEKLLEFIDEDIYDAYDPEFYERTEWLKQNGVIDYYITKMFGDQIYGGVRINLNQNYPVSFLDFQHGNIYSGEFESDDFVKMLNGEIESGIFNPFGFPSLIREPFLDDFKEWAEKNYARIFKEKCEELGINLDGTPNSVAKHKAESEATVKSNVGGVKKPLGSYKTYGTYNPLQSFKDKGGIKVNVDISEGGTYSSDMYS